MCIYCYAPTYLLRMCYVFRICLHYWIVFLKWLFDAWKRIKWINKSCVYSCKETKCNCNVLNSYFFTSQTWNWSFHAFNSHFVLDRGIRMSLRRIVPHDCIVYLYIVRLLTLAVSLIRFIGGTGDTRGGHATCTTRHEYCSGHTKVHCIGFVSFLWFTNRMMMVYLKESCHCLCL